MSEPAQAQSPTPQVLRPPRQMLQPIQRRKQVTVEPVAPICVRARRVDVGVVNRLDALPPTHHFDPLVRDADRLHRRRRHVSRVSKSIDLLLSLLPPENRLCRRPVLLLQLGRFWLRSTLHSYCTDSVARWSPRAPLSCVNGVRGLSEPPELHQRLGSGSLGRFAERPAEACVGRLRRRAELALPLYRHPYEGLCRSRCPIAQYDFCTTQCKLINT